MTTRRHFLKASVAGTGAAALATPALAQQRFEWRMVTSWPKRLPGPGVTAERIASRIAEASEGRLKITVHAAGELVPALEVFDAVSTGTAELAHTASLFWQGKMKAAPFFTAMPFGLTAGEHHAWIYHGGGQEVWDELYAPFGIKPYLGGNTGLQMGGWFRREINSVEDFKGLKMRMPGFGGEVIRRLGATPVSIPPGEIFSSLQSGVIDATEFLGPWSDAAMGFQKVAPYYYAPGFHEPNGTGEFLVSLKALETLPGELRAIMEQAVMAENSFSLAESEWFNAGTLEDLVSGQGVKLRYYPKDLLKAAQATSREVIAEQAAADPGFASVWESYEKALKRLSPWADTGLRSYLAARDA
ncbi:MAG: TRAP transporter substrate-binding protein [Flavobacteriaceae bacterium]